MLTVLALTDTDSVPRIIRLWAEWHGAWRFLLVFGFMLGVAWVLKTLLFKALNRLAGNTATNLDDTLLGALQWPARYWVVLSALVTAVADLDERDVPVRIAHGFSQAILILFVISMALAIARVSASSAPFDAEYAARSATPFSAAAEPTWTMTPPPAARMALTAQRETR